MNLYRNFGNLLENWVTEGCQNLYLQTGPGVDELDSISRYSVPLSNVKSESEDSGFETVSTTSPYHSHQCSALTSEESQQVFGASVDEFQPSSLSPSICSSSSSSVDLSSVAPKARYPEVEQALRRTDSPSWRRQPHQMESGITGPRYHSNTASFPTSFHSNSSRPHHRFARPRRTHSQPPDPKKAALYRKHLKLHQHGQPLHGQLEQLANGDQYRLDKLSPGLQYLEQVCRMLENIAKLQQQNDSLQKEVEILKSQHAVIERVSLHEEEISNPGSQRLQIVCLEDPPSESAHLKEPMVFRHRSVSDTQAIGRHRRARFVQDEPIAEVLVEEPDGKDSLLGNENKKQSKIQKLKFTSFRRQNTQQSDTESKSFQPKKKTRMASFFSRNRSMTTHL